MTTLITGAAGFIGSQLCRQLITSKQAVIGVDNFNADYDVQLKHDRLKRLNCPWFELIEADITDAATIGALFSAHDIKQVIHLAAVAGIQNAAAQPDLIMHNNVLGFSCILEQCRKHSISQLIYASSAAVYGDNPEFPVTENSCTDHPLSLYAASKKANETLAHSYAHLYGMQITGLRFFSVYGPWGRPDMALYKFTQQITSGAKISVHNHGNHSRDLIYIDDLVAAIMCVFNQNQHLKIPSKNHQIYNLGCNESVGLMEMIITLQQTLKLSTEHVMLPLQAGEIKDNKADASAFKHQFNWQPKVSFTEGVEKFVTWYQQYHQ